MSDIIILLIINTFVCRAIFNASSEGNALYFIPKYLGKLPNWVTKPMYDCPPCMASIHWWPYLVFYGLTVDQLKFIPVYILALSGMNVLFNSVINYLEGVK